MKQTILILFLAIGAVVSVAQSTTKSAMSKPATATRTATATGIKLPPGVPAVQGGMGPRTPVAMQPGQGPQRIQAGP